MRFQINNLSDEVGTDEIRRLVGMYGLVESLERFKDRTELGDNGYVIVEMPRDGEGEKAAAELDGKEFKGCTLSVATDALPQ